MQIGGFQKTSLLDYPDTISAIIWTVGCNFKCPFCYNPQLVQKKTDCISEEEVLSFLKKRKGLIEGVSISGGEPLLQKDIIDFIKKVKKLEYLVKIDTNGTFPDKLKYLIEKKLVDYIAMDVKAPKGKYKQLSGVKTNIKHIEESID
ncbi:MAG: anaerobic ribonucleoside-triphosphate reductase activating protein, partial [Candidatus Asgardarchaeum californiense]